MKSVESSESVNVIVACSPAVSDALLVVRATVGDIVSFVTEVSRMLTIAVDPTCKVRAASEYSFMDNVSAPSVVRSFAIVWVKVNLLVESVVPLTAN